MRRIGVVGDHHQHHADAAVEGAQHLLGPQPAGLVQPEEHRRRAPAARVDPRHHAVRQHARQVVDQAAAGDVGQRLDDVVWPRRLEQAADVDPGRHQQRARPGSGRARTAPDPAGTAPVAQDLADQREAVGVDAAGGEAEQDVAGGDVGPRQAPGPLDRADREAREVVVAAACSGPASRRSRRRSARSRASRQPSAMPAITSRGLLRIELRGGVVVEEEQRLGALDERDR